MKVPDLLPIKLVERLNHYQIVVTFSDATDAVYTVEELLALKPERVNVEGTIAGT